MHARNMRDTPHLLRSALKLSRRLAIERLEWRLFLDGSGEMFRLSRSAGDALTLAATSSIVPSSLPSSDAKFIEFQIQLTDKQGYAPETVRVDDELMLSIYVKDLRELPPNSLQLFSAYTELHLDTHLLQATGGGQLGEDFWDFDLHLRNQPVSFDQPRQIGGIVTAPYRKDTGHLLYSMPVRAIAEGEGTIDTKPIQGGTDSHPTTIYGANSPLGNTSLFFDSRPLVVLPKLSGPTSETSSISQPASQPISQPKPSPVANSSVRLDTRFSIPNDPLPSMLVASGNVKDRLVAKQTDANSFSSSKDVNDTRRGPFDELSSHDANPFHHTESSDIHSIRFSEKPTLSLMDESLLEAIATKQSNVQLDKPEAISRSSNSVRNSRSQIGKARDVVDHLLDRIASEKADEELSLGFRNSGDYSRAPIRRLPLAELKPLSQRAAFFEADTTIILDGVEQSVDLPAVSDTPAALHNEQFIGSTTTKVVANSMLNGSDQSLTFHRAPLVVISLAELLPTDPRVASSDSRLYGAVDPVELTPGGSANVSAHIIEPPTIGPPTIGPPRIGPPTIGPPTIGPIEALSDPADRYAASEDNNSLAFLVKYFNYILAVVTLLSVIQQGKQPDLWLGRNDLHVN